jgi:hypothetical protein
MGCDKNINGVECRGRYETAPNMWCRECRTEHSEVFFQLIHRKVNRVGELLTQLTQVPSAANWEEMEHITHNLRYLAESEKDRLNVTQPEKTLWATFPVCTDKCPRFRSIANGYARDKCSGPEGYLPTAVGGVCGPYSEQVRRDQAAQIFKLIIELENFRKEKGSNK